MENYISLHFNENKAQTLICGTETQITLFNIQKITVLLETQSHVLLNAVLLKSCWNISMT